MVKWASTFLRFWQTIKNAEEASWCTKKRDGTFHVSVSSLSPFMLGPSYSVENVLQRFLADLA